MPNRERVTAPADPELLLAAACCRWPPSPARDAAVHVAVARGIDWERFGRVVVRQRVPGSVVAALKAAGSRGIRYQWHIVRSVLYMHSAMYGSKFPPSLHPLYPMVRVPAWLISHAARVARHVAGRNGSAAGAGTTR